MSVAGLVAHQIEQMAARANAGLITQQQAHQQMNDYLAHVSPADKAKAMRILNRRLQQR